MKFSLTLNMAATLGQILGSSDRDPHPKPDRRASKSLLSTR